MSFNKRLTTLPSNTSVDDILECFERDGGCIVQNMLSPQTLEGLWADIGPELDATPEGDGEFVGRQTRRVSGLFNRSLHMETLITQPKLYEAAERWLVKPFKYWLNDKQYEATPALQVSLTQAIMIRPGEGLQPLHRDDIAHHRRHPGPDSQIQVLYALSDYSEAMGATRVIPGSHKWDDDRAPRFEESVPAEMNPGDGLLYLGSTYHGGGQNTTKDKPRTAIATTLVLGYLRQEENQYIAVPRQRVAQYSERVQRLLGWSANPPFCGWIEMRDPHYLVASDELNTKAEDIL
ncbi:phytanoyl-CoA dioxygenase [Burkholderia ubonensis]|uniref:phytanoyl-CoA dioxygenase family protein n=1 Tax=Burkholderia ubonensis TaxID=101571 RepID=UPI0007537733|nr:phytanoyl-CoA dioxygenase family protein [Burkholderia ubonensis]KVX09140.1 phytanoyl-CoA dioxygenase [Burkholderia ubonensis]KWB38520.1 phytanoyl-CoA dioxygenase [Burkholderia ubonensis]KWC23348.1 phytanoyl-CoA dioxygenase [Burkholderia ubonensis]